MTVGVTVNVCGAAELVNVSVTGVDRPPLAGVTVTVPVQAASGVTVKFDEAVFSVPPVGPVKV
jgi:hypothetical protein